MTAQPPIHRKTRKELLSEWRHAEVLDAAGRIFAVLGYSATNVEEIAKEAGMAKGTIYLYFKSKEEIFAEVLGRDLQALTDRTIEAMSAEEMFSGRVRIFLDLRLEYLRSKQNFLRIYLDEFASRSARPKPVADAMDHSSRPSGARYASKPRMSRSREALGGLSLRNGSGRREIRFGRDRPCKQGGARQIAVATMHHSVRTLRVRVSRDPQRDCAGRLRQARGAG